MKLIFFISNRGYYRRIILDILIVVSLNVKVVICLVLVEIVILVFFVIDIFKSIGKFVF